MAKSVNIHKIERIDGQVFVAYNYGDPPLTPVATSEISFNSDEDLKRNIQEIEFLLGERGLVLLHLAITYLNQSGNFNNVTQVYNKTLTLDPYAAQPLKIT